MGNIIQKEQAPEFLVEAGIKVKIVIRIGARMGVGVRGITRVGISPQASACRNRIRSRLANN